MGTTALSEDAGAAKIADDLGVGPQAAGVAEGVGAAGADLRAQG